MTVLLTVGADADRVSQCENSNPPAPQEKRTCFFTSPLFNEIRFEASEIAML